jgi:fatty acid desaturase
LSDFFVIIAAAILSWQTEVFWVYFLAMVLIGSRMRALNNLVHEASHYSLYQSKWLNLAVGWLCALPVLLSMSQYRTSHMLHHSQLGYDDDPDLVRERQLTQDGNQNRSLWQRLIRLPQQYVVYVFGSLYVEAGQTITLFWRLLAIVLPLVIGFVFYGEVVFKVFFLYWLLPFLTSYQVIKFIAEAGEHGGLYDSIDPQTKLQEKTIRMSRNTVPNCGLRVLVYPHGDGYHMLHHRFPAVPGLNLASFHDDLVKTGWYNVIGYENNRDSLVGVKYYLRNLFKVVI